jgi:MFS family permease
MTYRYLPESRDPDAASVDIPGQTFAMVGLGALTLVLVEGRSLAPAWITAQAALAVTCIAAFLWIQHRVAHPMLPLDLFRSPRLVAALFATFTMTFGIYGLLLANSFAFQQERGASALATAIWFLPMPLTYLALIPPVAALAGRWGPRLPMTAGLGVMASGMALYAAVGPQGNVWLLELSFVLAGAGLAVNTGPAVGLAMSAVPVQRAGLASGVVNLARLVGITVGVAALGSVLAADGVRAAMVLGGAVQLIGAAVTLRLARSASASPTTKEVAHA